MDLIELIKKHEGTGPIEKGRFMPYYDTEGLITIGYGRCLDHIGISQTEANYLLMNDIDQVINQCQVQFKWFNALNDARRAVIVSMVFNIGMSGFLKFKNTINLVVSGAYKEASIEMLNSKWAGQVGNRAIELSEMMKTGEW